MIKNDVKYVYTITVTYLDDGRKKFELDEYELKRITEPELQDYSYTVSFISEYGRIIADR